MASITLLRKRLALTQAELADRLSVSRVTISRWENGQVRPSKLALKALQHLARKNAVTGFDTRSEERPRSRPWQSVRQVPSAVPGSPEQRRRVRREDNAKAALLRSHQRIHALSKCPLFSDLDSRRLSELSRLARKRDLKAGQFLFFEDDPVESCYVVVSGMVKVIKHSASGKDFVTATYGPGEMMGNLLLFLGSPYTASCQAVIDSSALAIGSEDFLSFLHRHPEPSFFVLEKMLRVAGKRHIDVTARLSEFAPQRVDYRLARVLFMLSLKFGLTIPLTRREIARHGRHHHRDGDTVCQPFEEDGSGQVIPRENYCLETRRDGAVVAGGAVGLVDMDFHRRERRGKALSSRLTAIGCRSPHPREGWSGG